jgi:CHAD domain-containing protein
LPYHISNHTDLPEQVEDLARHLLSDAAECVGVLPPSADALHEARLGTKRYRALLSLLEESLGKRGRRYDLHVAGAARALSALRDADVGAETMRKLADASGGLIPGATAMALQRALTSRAEAARAGAGAALRDARTMLLRAAETMPAAMGQVATAAAIRRGLVVGYRRARRAFRELPEVAESDALHRWRRRVKRHGYQLKLCAAGLDEADARIEALAQLDEGLGEEHNLALLEVTLLRHAAETTSPRRVAIVLGCLVQRRAALRSAARAPGSLLFAERPADFARTIGHWW